MDNFISILLLPMVILVASLPGVVQAQSTRAECEVGPNSDTPVEDQQPITGTVYLEQTTEGGTTTIRVELLGFNTTDGEDTHGFHIHTDGDLTNGCQSTGGHYNPEANNHGAPGDVVRHVGDLGNIQEAGDGPVSVTITDTVVNLIGNDTVINRAIVIHETRDDLGLGGDAGSITTGNAGARLACCIITEVTYDGAQKTSAFSLVT